MYVDITLNIRKALLGDQCICMHVNRLHHMFFFPQNDGKVLLFWLRRYCTFSCTCTHTVAGLYCFEVLCYGVWCRENHPAELQAFRARQVWECWFISLLSLLSDLYLPVWLSYRALRFYKTNSTGKWLVEEPQAYQ